MPIAPHRALITGASSGIGAAFARSLAARKTKLILAARRVDRLEALAAEITAAHGVEVTVLPIDLSTPDAGPRLRQAVGDLEVDAVINNAGFGTRATFVDEDPAEIDREIMVDVVALVSITRAFLPDMVARGNGVLVNVASTISYQPMPGMAVYAASKAFVRSFTEALWYETRNTGVKAFALSPGATSTEFFDNLSTDSAVGSMQTAEQVVDFALAQLDSNNTPPSQVSGFANRFTAEAVGFLPRRLVISSAARAIRYRQPQPSLHRA